MSHIEELLDIQQAAAFLNVSETSLRRWTNAGRLRCLRVGGRRERRFRRSDLVAFLEEQPTQSGPQSWASAVLAAGGEQAGALAPLRGKHLCGLYASTAERDRLAQAFLAEGLRAGSISYLVAGPRVRQGILARLRTSHPTVDADLAAGRLVVSEYAASARAQIGYFREQFAAASAAGAQSMRVVGEVWDLLARTRKRELHAYEKAYAESIASRFPVLTLCLYDARRFTGTEVLGILHEHTDWCH